MYKLLEIINMFLKMSMLLSNSKDISEFRSNKYYLSYPLLLNLKQFKDFYET